MVGSFREIFHEMERFCAFWEDSWLILGLVLGKFPEIWSNFMNSEPFLRHLKGNSLNVEACLWKIPEKWRLAYGKLMKNGRLAYGKFLSKSPFGPNMHMTFKWYVPPPGHQL